MDYFALLLCESMMLYPWINIYKIKFKFIFVFVTKKLIQIMIETKHTSKSKDRGSGNDKDNNKSNNNNLDRLGSVIDYIKNECNFKNYTKRSHGSKSGFILLIVSI